jgi:hypothetical protein
MNPAAPVMNAFPTTTLSYTDLGAMSARRYFAVSPASNTLPVQTKPSRCATCVNASRNPLTELETLFGRDVSSPRHAFLYATSNVGT